MLSKVWAAVGAIVCGVILATLPAGSMPSIARLVLLAALLGGIGGNRRGAGDAGDRQKRRRTPANPGEPSESDLALSATDNLALVSGVIDASAIDWLRRETFDLTTGATTVVAPIRRLAVLKNGSGRYDHFLERLTKAASSFLHVYDGNTIADPMIRDSKWRMLGERRPRKASPRTRRNRGLPNIQIDLRYAAAELCESYDALVNSVTETSAAR